MADTNQKNLDQSFQQLLRNIGGHFKSYADKIVDEQNRLARLYITTNGQELRDQYMAWEAKLNLIQSIAKVLATDAATSPETKKAITNLFPGVELDALMPATNETTQQPQVVMANPTTPLMGADAATSIV